MRKAYDLVIDVRSVREYAEDHIPGAMNLPVVNNEEYVEVDAAALPAPADRRG